MASFVRCSARPGLQIQIPDQRLQVLFKVLQSASIKHIKVNVDFNFVLPSLIDFHLVFLAFANEVIGPLDLNQRVEDDQIACLFLGHLNAKPSRVDQGNAVEATH